MRIIISPAKKMVVDTDSFAVKEPPIFLERAEREGRVAALGDDLPRSFVLADGGEGRPVIYLVPLSPAALSARAERDLPI